MSMEAVVYKGPKEVAIESVNEPELEHPNDVLIDITTSAICGSDLHMYEGRTAAEPGIVFGHENMGIVTDVGEGVTTLEEGDRVVDIGDDAHVLMAEDDPRLGDRKSVV